MLTAAALAAFIALSAIGAGLFWFMRSTEPSGGAAYQEAPHSVRAGGDAQITLRLAVWGGGTADPRSRYRDVVAEHRVVGAADWQPAIAQTPMGTPHRVGDRQELRFVFVVRAPQVASGQAMAIEYRFSFSIDGHPRSVPGQHAIRVTPD